MGNGFLNTTLETMTPFLKKRSQMIFSNQQKRCREHSGASLPYTLDELRSEVILPRINDPLCAYCCNIVISESTFQIDHIFPLVRGGTWNLRNLILVCAECNIVKGAMTGDEYMQFLELMYSFHPFAGKDLCRRIKIGSNPLAARLIAGK